MADTEAPTLQTEERDNPASVQLHVPASDARRKILAIAALLVGGWIFVMGMIVSYSEALVHPALNNAVVAVAGDADSIVALEQRDDISVTVVADDAAAQAEVTNRDADAAIVISTDPDTGVTTYVASGASPALARAITAVGNEVAQSIGDELTQANGGQTVDLSNTVVDLAAPSENNPNATLEFYVIIFVTIGASFGATIISRILGKIRTSSQFLARTFVLALMSAALASGAAFYATHVIEGITGEHGWAYFGALFAYCFAVSSALTGIASIAGTIAGALVSVLIMMLGNSASGGPFGIRMQNDFFQALHWVVPQSWGLEMLRDIEFFDGNGIGRPIAAIAVWAGVGLLATLAGMLIAARKANPGRRFFPTIRISAPQQASQAPAQAATPSVTPGVAAARVSGASGPVVEPA